MLFAVKFISEKKSQSHADLIKFIKQKMQKATLKAKKNVKAPNQKGFTMVELISVIVILGVLFSVVIKKADLLSDSASLTALKYGLGEINSRETAVWFKTKIEAGYSNDTAVYDAIDKNIGPGYDWNPGPNQSGGRLHFKSNYIDLTRVASTPTSPGIWK